MIMVTQRFDLSNKVVLITGAAGLLGIEHAAALLECNASVILTDISQETLNTARIKLLDEFPGGEIFCYFMDVSCHSSVFSTYQKLTDEGLHIDVLINNAAIDPKVKGGRGIVDETSRLENFSREQWDLQIAVGLTGAFHCSQIFGAAMARSGQGGSIVNIASDLSIIAPDQRLYRQDSLSEDDQPVKPVTYSVIKAGLIGLTRYLATYWADRGIRCNAFSPGGVFNDQSDPFMQHLSGLIPLGRMAKRDEYRAAMQFLCSDASSYMNGQNIVMDGGRSVW